MILERIADYARERVEQDQRQISLETMKEIADKVKREAFIFEKTLKMNSLSIISEVKKASPSKGIISETFPYLQIAKEYQEVGCHCLSVLTEPKWFLGSDAIFQEIRKETTLPMLRKDFTVDPYQIYQAKAMGADAILLICGIMDQKTLENQIKLCDNLGISALVETHNKEEIIMAEASGARVLGVNNRNLNDFSVDLGNASDLRQYVNNASIFVAESGITSPEDGILLAKKGADALLIGEALMKTEDKRGFVTALMGGVKS